MDDILVTLDVLKLSGWLNANAVCRVERRACDAGREGYGPGGVRALGGGDAIVMHGEGPTQGWGGQGTRGAHGEHAVHGRDAGGVEAQRLVECRRAVEHEAHVCDAGGVEAQRLVERRRVLPRVERRACDVGRGAGYRERPEAAGDRGARGVQGRPRLCRLGAGHGEEHTLNM